MSAGFYSLVMLIEQCMWSEGPQAWLAIPELQNEENQ